MNDKILLSASNLSDNSFLKEMLIQEESPFFDNINSFESKLELYLSNKNVAALNSGTSAIHLALILSGVVLGDEVLCQSFTFVASANPIVYLGAKPIFIDSEKDTWNMCPKYLEEAIKDRILKGKKPKAIIIVHSYGMPAKIDEIILIANKYKIELIEDAAGALGSTFKKIKCGTFGKYGVFSFNRNKIITTSGGGAIVCNREIDKQKVISLATQARINVVHYQHQDVGYNYRISNILAGIGVKQFDLLDKYVSRRRKNNQFYSELFNNMVGITLHKEPNPNYFSNHWLTCILVNEKLAGFSKEDLRLQLLKDHIESRPLWKPMHLQPVYKDCSYYGESVSERLFKSGLCLPSGSNLTENDFERITTSIKKFL
ncbi:DegT/DnrJ/EryC1/StrS family aminotransferase [Polaribacter sp. SA4-12]|uniref:DegT/DnrJ/EryC1/StrS family aminotransferase n=1 Tax=Polaribacter sp. SA4-12 TaxID=1312072 RepID=UPI000B57A519|nr:DegT/DnrJ/EryC1/StrS family aminotransferase [Polaribacter sp. SA4-12]ARV15105.1 pyridoxal phosphate-dependent aminotransferase [Polaribacter sp. SA4-12]